MTVRCGLDTNVLVFAHIASLPKHPQVHAFLADQLQRENVMLVVTPGVLHEFLHVVTDPRRFDPPVSMPEALSLARLYLDHTNIECVATDGSILARALELIQQHDLGRKRIADTLLYATFERHGVEELLTCNPDDFRVFAGIPLVDPSV